MGYDVVLDIGGRDQGRLDCAWGACNDRAGGHLPSLVADPAHR